MQCGSVGRRDRGFHMAVGNGVDDGDMSVDGGLQLGVVGRLHVINPADAPENGVQRPQRAFNEGPCADDWYSWSMRRSMTLNCSMVMSAPCSISWRLRCNRLLLIKGQTARKWISSR